jgi:hypothetical protein
VIDHVWLSAFGGSGLCFKEIEVQNTVTLMKNVFYGITRGGAE